MAWLRLILDSNGENADSLSDLLERFSAVSISYSAQGNEDLHAEGGDCTAGIWERTRISALLHEDVDLDTLLVSLRDRAGAEQTLHHRIELLEDRDWTGEIQRQYWPKYFGEKLCVCPSWCRPPENGEYTIILDPGLAFGTGAHDTTTLCLEWLAAHDLLGKQIVDYGCGSGILALSALRLGAEHAWAVDIDPLALEVSRNNAERNQLLSRITIAHPGGTNLPPADILLANILLDPLKDLAGKFAELVLPAGSIVLSGLLATQVVECLAVYETWFTMRSPFYRREWALLQGEKRPF